MKQVLQDYLGQLALDLSDSQQEQLLAYVQLIAKWNKVTNLTAIRETDKMISHHIIDSLLVCDYIEGSTVLDVGSGAGLPGIPLAVCFPHKKIALLDSNSKKTRFLQQAITELGLTNVSVHHARVQDHQQLYSIVISRAFASLVDFVHWCRHCLTSDGVFYAMKGHVSAEELAAIPSDIQHQAIALPAPFGESRHIVKLTAN